MGRHANLVEVVLPSFWMPGIGDDRRRLGHTGAFTWGTNCDLQSLLAPQPVDLFLVDCAVLVVAQRRPRTAKPMTRVFGGVRTQPGAQIGIRVSRGVDDTDTSVG